jgi:hypothetical protein
MKSSSGQRRLAGAAALGLAVETLAALRDLARGVGVGDHDHLVAGHRHAGEAEHLHGDRRAGRLDRLAALVEQRAHATGVHAADEVVAHAQRAVLHEHGGHGALARVELGLDDRAGGGAVGVGLEVEDLGLQEDLLEQVLDVGALLGDSSRWPATVLRRSPRARRRAAGAPA